MADLIRLVAACLLLTACEAEPERTAPSAGAAGLEAVKQEALSEQAKAAIPEAIGTIGPLIYRYDPSQLTPVEAVVPVPPNWDIREPGIKLIATERAKLLGTAECLYGHSGQASRCNAEQEAGLAFAVVDEAYEALGARLAPGPQAPVELAGLQGLSWTVGAEGEGAQHILLPAGDRTVLIVRQFRNSGNPPEAAVTAVLQSLRGAS